VRLAAVRIFVTDLDASVRWYARMLGKEPTAGDAAQGFFVFDVGADLVLEAVGDDSDIPAAELIGRFTGVSFAVTDIAASLTSLAATGVRTSAPELQAWGGTLATVVDPDGNQLQLVQYPALG
jgi:catechol 2,3-dioxygenase-like lactoylglutathione lyase family enzyme